MRAFLSGQRPLFWLITVSQAYNALTSVMSLFGLHVRAQLPWAESLFAANLVFCKAGLCVPALVAILILRSDWVVLASETGSISEVDSLPSLQSDI